MEEIDLSELMGLVDDVVFEEDAPIVIEPLEDSTEEEETSDAPAEEEEQKEVEEKVVETVNTSEVTESYMAMQALIEAGELEDFIVEIEGEEVQLSEYKNIDKETLKDVISSYKDKLKEEANNEVVSVKDLDETKKALIDIIIKGDYDEVKNILSEPSVLKDPFEGYDNSNQDHNIKVYMAYLVSAQGHSQDEAEALTEIAIKNNSIDEKSLKIVETHRENTKKAVLAEQQRVQALEAEKKERIKTYAKDLDETYKSYGLRPEKVLQLKKVATQMNKVGNLPIDEVYDNLMKDPKTAADLILFMTEKELYDKRVYATAKKDSDIQSVKKIQLISKSKSKPAMEQVTESKDMKTINEFSNLIIED